jgi:hypothetical protein
MPPSQISIALKIFSGAIPRALLHPFYGKTASEVALRIPVTAGGKLPHTSLRDFLFGSAFLNRHGFMLIQDDSSVNSKEANIATTLKQY